MSVTTINNKIRLAGKKVAKKIGDTSILYRPYNYDYKNPMRQNNYVSNKFASIVYNDKVTKTQNYNFQLMTLYTEEYDVKVGDIFVGTDTFVCVSNRSMEPQLAILCNEQIKIERAVYNTTGGYSAKSELIAENVPCSQTASPSSNLSDPSRGNLQGGANIRNWDVHVWMPANFLKPSDTVTFSSGLKGIIKSYEYTPLGYVLKIQETK